MGALRAFKNLIVEFMLNAKNMYAKNSGIGQSGRDRIRRSFKKIETPFDRRWWSLGIGDGGVDRGGITLFRRKVERHDRRKIDLYVQPKRPE